MFAADNHSSTLSRAVGIARELAIAVMLSLVIVTTAGGVTDASMRISVVVAAVYLTAAEVRRQLPDLAAYAISPFKQFVVNLLEPILETIRLSIASAFQHNRMDLPSRLNLPAAPQRENTREERPERQYGHDDLSTVIRDLTQLRIEIERQTHLVLELLSGGHEWRHHHDELATLIRDLTERTIAAEKQVGLLADRIDHLTSALDHSSSAAVGDPRVEPINSTETANRLEYLLASELSVSFVGSAASLKNVLVVVDDPLQWSAAKTHLERDLELLPRRYVISGLPTIYRKQFDTLHALRTDPAAFKRFIEELLYKLAETGHR